MALKCANCAPPINLLAVRFPALVVGNGEGVAGGELGVGELADTECPPAAARVDMDCPDMCLLASLRRLVKPATAQNPWDERPVFEAFAGFLLREEDLGVDRDDEVFLGERGEMSPEFVGQLRGQPGGRAPVNIFPPKSRSS